MQHIKNQHFQMQMNIFSNKLFYLDLPDVQRSMREFSSNGIEWNEPFFSHADFTIPKSRWVDRLEKELI